MRLLVTGSRRLTESHLTIVKDAIEETADELRLVFPADPDRLTIIHGGAPGADQLAHRVAAMIGANVWKFPAEWKFLGKSAGPLRNQEMLDTIRPDYGLAFPDAESEGTLDMLDRLRAAGIGYRILHMDTLARLDFDNSALRS